MELRWDRLNWQDIKRLTAEGYDTVLIPVGTIEAHGCIPLGTDNIIPETMANRIAPELKTLVAPTINYGITHSLIAYPGSLTVTPETFTSYMTEIMLSFIKTGMKNLIVLNGHGGQIKELKDAAFKVHYETDIKVAVIHWWEMVAGLEIKHYGKTGGHAALDETAALQACAPETVQPDLYKPEMHYRVQRGTNVYPNPGTILNYDDDYGELDFDQGKADAFFDEVCRKVVDFIKDIKVRWEE